MRWVGAMFENIRGYALILGCEVRYEEFIVEGSNRIS